MKKPNKIRPKKTSPLAIPKEWTFRSKVVAEAFDSHVRTELPWYSLATGIVTHIARCYVPQGGTVIDVGASTGNIGRALAPTLEARGASLIAIDGSPEMAKVYDAPGQFIIADAEAFDYAAKKPDLIVAFLALMFVPIARRMSLITRMMGAISPGGAIVIFDKTPPRAGYLGTVAYRLTLAAKYEAGAIPADIIAKELSISGLQRPLTEDEIAGFVEVFRFGDFAGFVYERAIIKGL
jgi:tRNA (cmo5U34)-methyltransferase